MDSKKIKLLSRYTLERLRKGISTDFLEPNELLHIIPFLKKNHIKFKTYEIFDQCSKKIIYSGNLPSVTCFKIDCKMQLRHQDILGSLFAHNIKNNIFSDIVIMGDDYYIVIMDYMKDYFINFYDKIGNATISLNEVDISSIAMFTYMYEDITLIVPSMRLDVVISKLIGTSRRIVQEMINDSEVSLNYDIFTNKSYEIKNGDILSIRKVGKYKYSGIITLTKKNNYLITLKKYI